MATFSNFVSDFKAVSQPSTGTDLMSTVYIPSNQLPGNVSGYMYIGELLINFSCGQIVNNTDITFPKSFTQLYGIVCTSVENNTASAQGAGGSSGPTGTSFRFVSGSYGYYIAWGTWK